jgi:hypothetical protein
MTTFRLPFNGRNLAGMDSQVLRPIITEFHWDSWDEEGEEDRVEEEEDPVVAEYHKTESKKQEKSDVVFIFHKTENLSTSHPVCSRKVDGNRQGNAPTHLERNTSSPPVTSTVDLLRRRSPWIGWPLR